MRLNVHPCYIIVIECNVTVNDWRPCVCGDSRKPKREREKEREREKLCRDKSRMGCDYICRQYMLLCFSVSTATIVCRIAFVFIRIALLLSSSAGSFTCDSESSVIRIWKHLWRIDHTWRTWLKHYRDGFQEEEHRKKLLGCSHRMVVIAWWMVWNVIAEREMPVSLMAVRSLKMLFEWLTFLSVCGVY